MTLPRRRFLHLAAAAAALPVTSQFAQAQAYPARPVKLIVPYAPGGPTDVAARLLAQELSDRLGKQFFVENLAGAGGNIGTGQAAKAAADGYTVLIAVNSHVINPTLYASVPYDPYKDFDPITLAVGFSTAFLINPSLPARTVKEFVAYAKANPGKLSFASSGFGTPSHLLGEQFRITQGLDMVHVPYNGSGQAIGSVVPGHTPVGFLALSAAAPFAKDGKVRVLAVMSKKRSEALPDVPTIGEAGFPGLEGDGWIGALVPAGTAKEIVALLHREINAIIAKPEIKARLAVLGLDPVGTTPEEFTALMKEEAEKWAKVIRAAGLKAK
jgi:tripartite-type tricarboxylate transporter receptor subunit TctC